MEFKNFISLFRYFLFDDVKSAFRQCKYHPDVASAFSFVISQFLFIPLGGTFGAITSPPNFEPIARARVHLAQYLSTRTMQKNAEIIWVFYGYF